MLLPKTPHPLACHIKYDRFPTSAAVDRALIRAFSVGFAGDDLQKKGSWTVLGCQGTSQPGSSNGFFKTGNGKS